MNVRKNLLIATLMTVATTVLLGVVYPLVVTVMAHMFFRDKANGQLMERGGRVVGSAIIGQGFSAPGYFHSRGSAAANGYDAANSGGSNLGPTNKKLIDAVKTAVDAARKENPGMPIPIDLVTTSASGVDPDITPDNAMFQVSRVARARGIGDAELRQFVIEHVEGRQWGLLGEPRVNVLLLNIALDERWSRK